MKQRWLSIGGISVNNAQGMHGSIPPTMVVDIFYRRMPLEPEYGEPTGQVQ